MNTLPESKQIAYKLLAQALLLLLVHAAAALLAAVKFLPEDPLALSIYYHHAAALSHVMLGLALVSGLLGGGLYVAVSEQTSAELPTDGLLRLAFRLWSLLLVLAFLAGLLGLLDGRHMLELPLLLELPRVLLAALLVWLVLRSAPERTPFMVVWTAGMALGLLCAVAGLLPADYLGERVLRVVAVHLRLHVADTLAGVALAFWLMRRISNVPQAWADRGLYNLAGLLALAGVLLAAGPLHTLPLDIPALPAVLLLVPAAYLLLAAHSYRALSDRGPAQTLAAHWLGLAVLLLLVQALLGALAALPSVAQWVQGTRLSDLQLTLVAFALLALVLGVINQAAAELRLANERITGLLPFWLVSFGLLGGGLALAAAGVVQTYLERVLTVGYLDTQALLVPLYAAWLLGLLLLAAGLGVYALGFRARMVATQQPD